MNNKGILLPSTAYQDEYDYLKNETDLEVGVLDTKFNALGNVICANDKGAIVSPALSKEDCKTISDVMDVEVLQKKIAGSHLSGVSVKANNTGGVIHPEAEEKDIEIIADVLSVKMEQTSINGGVPYVTSGILANNHCIIVGSMTSGSEIMNLTRAFLN
jgi:translation initiation factor 6